MGVVRMAFILVFCVFAKATRPSDDGGMELEGHDETTEKCLPGPKCCCCTQTIQKNGGGGETVKKSEVKASCNGEPSDCKTACEKYANGQSYGTWRCTNRNGRCP
mmetsp:Transcript_40281/g.113908  ORF Transcript_40281/g.113908 Transcript_40281/m.113908 type:complete len:105 (+) Transcript_40281:88-402(+)